MIFARQQHAMPSFCPTFHRSGFTLPLFYYVIEPQSEEEDKESINDCDKKKQQLVEADGNKSSEANSEVTYRTRNALVYETKEEYSISFDLPGVKVDDILIELDDDTLKLQAERKYGNKKLAMHNKKFTIDTTLVDTNEIKSNLEDGVLTLTLRKKNEIKPFFVPVVASDPPADPEEGKGLYLTLNAPGVKSSDAKVEFSKGRLLVEYERKNKRVTDSTVRMAYAVNEATVDVQKLEAFLLDGLLTITAPVKPAEPKKIIKVANNAVQIGSEKAQSEELDDKEYEIVAETAEDKEIVVETVEDKE